MQRLLPQGLNLYTFEGRAYVGLVPFTMTGVRPIWVPPVPGLSNFHECNVRTYVHVEGRDPGVWFFSLDAANPIAVRIARATWKLPYFYARMRLTKTAEPDPEVDYQTERLWPGPLPAACTVRYRPTGTVTPAAPGTLEHFLAERYLLYVSDRGRLLSGHVHHVPYPLQRAEVDALEESLIAAAGIRRPDEAPLAHYAAGVRVHVFGLTPAGAAAATAETRERVFSSRT